MHLSIYERNDILWRSEDTISLSTTVHKQITVKKVKYKNKKIE